MAFKDLFQRESTRLTALTYGQVVPEQGLCVQCGICTFNCPVGIDVRQHVWEGKVIDDSYCLTCGECLQRCPRGVLHFERTDISILKFQ